MTVDINVVAENLSQLLTNYTNLASVFYDIFLNGTPMDVTLQQYDSDNILQTYIIPNRAKDKETSNVLTGTVDPEGTIEASVGAMYINTESQKAYLKVFGEGVSGWEAIFSSSTPNINSITSSSSPYTVLSSDQIIVAETMLGNLEIVLPSVGSSKTIKWLNGDGNLTISVDNNGTIDNLSSFTFNSNFLVGSSVTLYNQSNGVWIIT